MLALALCTSVLAGTPPSTSLALAAPSAVQPECRQRETGVGTARGTVPPLSANHLFYPVPPLLIFQNPSSFPSRIHPHPHQHHPRQPPRQKVGIPQPHPPNNSLCFPRQDDPSAIQLAGASLTIRHGSFFHDHITNEQLHDTESRRHTLSPTGAPASEGVRRSQLSFCEDQLDFRPPHLIVAVHVDPAVAVRVIRKR